jgi:hypothetical protein
MGARSFMIVGRGKNITWAFWSAVIRECRVHGNDGYTGTIAEKYEWVVFDVEGKGSARDVARWALELGFDPADPGKEIPSGMPPDLLPFIVSIALVTNDTSGPAGAIRVTTRETHDPVETANDEEAYLFFGQSPY